MSTHLLTLLAEPFQAFACATVVTLGRTAARVKGVITGVPAKVEPARLVLT